MKASMAALALVAAFACSTTFAADSANAPIEQGLKIAPVALKYDANDRAQVGRGSYIVNALGGCAGCHTMPTFEPGGDPFKGEAKKFNVKNYLAGGKCFGPIKSPNITPDDKGHPGGLAFTDFVQSIRTGKRHIKDKDGNEGPAHDEIQKVMPWPEFRDMTDDDLNAVYAYLSAIPHAEPSNMKCPAAPTRK